MAMLLRGVEKNDVNLVYIFYLFGDGNIHS